MKRKLLLYLLSSMLIMFWGQTVMAQIGSYYTFSESSGTYAEITGGTVSTASGDDGEETGVAIGFNFDYVGTTYTTVTIGVNGAISFTSTNIEYTNDLASTTASKLDYVAPLWDDMYARAGDSYEIRYETAGTAPNRTFTVQWKNISWRNTGSTVNFQIVLFEGSNNIEFIYGVNNSTEGRTASIGLNVSPGGVNNFISVTPGSPATTSTTTANNSISTADYPGDGHSYLFAYAVPACPNVTNLTVSNATTTTADLTWNQVSGSAGYNWEVVASGGTPGTGTAVSSGSTNAGNDTTATATGLTASTTYDAYVQNDCGSAWTGPTQFTTACNTITSFPYTETFDGMPSSSPGYTCTADGSVPLICWSNYVGEDIDWDIIAGATGSSSTGPSDDVTGGGKYLYTESSSCYSHQGTVLSPVFDLSSLSLPQLTFYYHMYGAAMGTMSVDYTTNGGTSWTQVWTLSGDQGNSWTQESLILSDLIGETNVQFRWVGVTGTSYTSDMAFDQVEVKEGPTTPIFGINPDGTKDYGECPLNNNSSGYYTQTFTISNDGGGTMTVNSTSITGTDASEFSKTDGNSYPVSLGPGQSMTVDVTYGPTSVGSDTAILRVNYGSSPAVDHDVQLTGNAYVAPPRQLEGAANGQTQAVDLTWKMPLPEGEIRYDDGSAETWYWVTSPSTDTDLFYTRFNASIAGNLNYIAVYNKAGSGNNWANIFVCPDDGTGKPDLSSPSATFVAPTVNSAVGEWNLLELTTPVAMALDEVFYIVTQWPDGNADGPYVGTDTDQSSGRCAYSNDNGAVWHSFAVSFIMRAYMSAASPRETLKIVAGSEVSGSENLPVVSIMGEENFEENYINESGLSLPVPDINVEGNSASRSFTNYSVYRGDATGVYNQTFTGIGTTSYTDATIAPSTTYFYAVKGIYSNGDTSDFSNEISVTTFSSCPEPTDQVEDTITTTSADLNWTENGSAAEWQIMIDTTGFDTAGYTSTTTITAKPYPATGLDMHATYDWYIRASCGSGSYSEWVGPHTFTTIPENDHCSGAVSLSVAYDTTYTTGTNVGATESNNNPYPIPAPTCGSYNGGDVWYTATVPASGYLRLIADTVPGSVFTDGAMAYYTGSCGSLTFGDCNDDGGPGLMPEITINADSLAGQTIYIRFWEYGNNSFGEFYITATTVPTVAEWDGSTDDNWFDKTNWDVNGVPGEITVVTIPTGITNYPKLAAATTIDSLVVESDASGDASILGDNYLTVTTNATVQRYTTAGVWHDYSASVQGQTLDDLYLGGSPDVWITHYNEPDNSRTYMTDVDSALDVGAGYELWVGGTSAVTYNFTGALNRGDVALTSASTPALSYTGADPLGYNLIGNPFASPIALDSGSWNMAHVDSTFWVWSSTLYKDYNTTTKTGSLTGGIIPMGQGFFIHANAASPTITIPMAARVHSSQAYYKSTRSNDLDMMKLRAMFDNDKYDELNILFIDGADELFESRDTRKMFAFNGNAPQVYAIIPDEELSQNSLPALNPGDERTVAVGYKAGVNGNQTLVADLSSLPETDVVLEDLRLNEFQNLNNNPVYTFEATTYQDPDRFRLHFNRSITGIDANSATSGIRAYSFEKSVYIVSNKELSKQKKELTIYDMMGRTMVNKILPPGDIIRVPVNASNAYVVLRVISNGEVYTTKVFIK